METAPLPPSGPSPLGESPLNPGLPSAPSSDAKAPLRTYANSAWWTTVRALDRSTAPDDESEDSGSELRINSAGAFSLTCPTPHPEVEVLVVVRGVGNAEVEWRERLQPLPDETRELVVEIP